MHIKYLFVLFITGMANVTHAKPPITMGADDGKSSFAFDNICSPATGGKSYTVTIKYIYAFSMKNASQLNVEFNENLDGMHYFPVANSNNNDIEDGVAREQVEKLLTLAYLNKMELEVCIAKNSVFGVRLK